mmetsp:Transcript_12312/g.17720  ORF Transcript_12312/g.17720 Transcript_12312/m.17720 type:complete len:89 (+) Transcript_12312:1201-1467(+)
MVGNKEYLAKRLILDYNFNTINIHATTRTVKVSQGHSPLALLIDFVAFEGFLSSSLLVSYDCEHLVSNNFEYKDEDRPQDSLQYYQVL